MKKLVGFLALPAGLIVGVVIMYWFLANPQDSYRMPIIIIWLPDVIGWDAFFILIGIIGGAFTWGGLRSWAKGE
ncbi:MAG: hypothetical protein P8N92_07345 [Burkholderiales bacterium]|jgi:hypothetical protein|nr:hypothetical protein [Burkholderiales bacterium]